MSKTAWIGCIVPPVVTLLVMLGLAMWWGF